MDRGKRSFIRQTAGAVAGAALGSGWGGAALAPLR